jgi:hypothetical protein
MEKICNLNMETENRKVKEERIILEDLEKMTDWKALNTGQTEEIINSINTLVDILLEYKTESENEIFGQSDEYPLKEAA